MHGDRIFSLIIIVLASRTYCATIAVKCEDIDVQKLCFDQENCGDCMQAHECCNWCYHQAYVGRSRCNTIFLSECPSDKIEYNSDVNVSVPAEGNKDFTKISKNTKFENVNQMKPQFADIRLRTGVPVNFSFSYKPAENYPLELYYLGDLSASMYKSLEIFKTIGTDLPNNLTRLTENYKLAFGSFMDKTGMPFYFTDPERFENPCKSLGLDCETGYLFRHSLNFTRNTEVFTKEILKSKTTANLDDLDGALDALWQILVCKNQTGWSTNSRKIVLLPTDSLLHTAGDGILVGAVLRPREECLLDEKGNHMEPLKYDYPSLGEMDKLLKEKKVNIIFAVHDKIKLEYYKNLTNELVKDSAFVGELEADSRNILDLITKGYYNFAQQVSFSINNSVSPDIDVKFFASCEGNEFNESSVCYNVQDEAVHFMVQLTLKEQPNTEGNVILYIEEKNIHEKITLNVSYPGKCSCKNYEGELKNCSNGEFTCGECTCNEGWSGQLCDEECNEQDLRSCRQILEYYTPICSGNGDCLCGKCKCDFPYEGKFCQNYCPNSNFQRCGGPSRGTCSEGKCVCKQGFKGDDCTCSTSSDNCRLLNNMEECSGRGTCECNECSCNAGFSGRYCEIRENNNTLCEDYRVYVENALVNGTYKVMKEEVEFEVEEVVAGEQKTFNCDTSSCETIIFQGTTRCTVDFCYYSDRESNKIHLLASKSCIYTATFKAISTGVSVFLALFLGGLIAIAMYKYKIHRQERAEYKRFVEEQKNTTELNPIYKSPVREYENPLRRK